MSGKKSNNGRMRRQVTLTGRSPIMFDRYAGDNKTDLPVAQRVYQARNGGLVIPSGNVLSFLCAKNTTSAPKRFMDKRKYKDTCDAIQSYCSIEPFDIPLCRDGKQIMFDGKFDADDRNEAAGMYIHRSVARLDKGIPNPKVRPVVDLPWEIQFTLSLFDNDEVSETEIKNFFIRGGMALGLGTFRGTFGKFEVTGWEGA